MIRGRKPSAQDQDAAMMRIAIAEARRGLGKTRPNPPVGAVIARAGRVIAQGHHQHAGGPHAEIVAIERAGTRARGGTLYVTLEPCAHVGRTGPCVDAIIAAKISRVVVGCRDENPLVDGRGLRRLRRAGISVTTACLEDQCRELTRAFFCWIRHGRPFITLKSASSLDGIIGDHAGVDTSAPRPGVRWLTGTAARTHAHKMRAQHDAILVGIGTILADDPLLTIRHGQAAVQDKRKARQTTQTSAGLLRVVLDSHLRMSPSCRLLNEPTAGPPPLIIAGDSKPRVVGRRGFDQRRRALIAAGAEVVTVAADRQGRPQLADAMALLAERNVQSLLVEGGSQISGAFVSAGLVDRVAAFVAPKLVGGGISATSGSGRGILNGLALGPFSVTHLDADLLLEADVLQEVKSKRA